jgi:Mg-chelatase subunit ChlD
MILSSFQQSAYAQTEKKEKYKITLWSRSFTPEPGIKPLLRENLMAKFARKEKQHVIIQFTELPNRAVRQRLQTKGIRLLSYIGGNAYYSVVGLPEALEFETLTAKRDPVLSLVRWMGQIMAADRAAPNVLAGKFGDWAKNRDGTVKIRVVFFKDIASADQIKILRRYTDKSKKHSPNIWQLSIKTEKIKSLITEDGVRWIEQEPPPYEPVNDTTRNLIGVDVVQDFDLLSQTYNGYSGNGIQVMVRDTGIDAHDDFQGRLLASSPIGINHGTHVAGIIGSSGVRSDMNDDNSNPNGGTPFQWRGMAPRVELVGYTMGWDTVTYNNAMTTYGVDISNHSHTQFGDTGYNTDSESVDNVVRDNSLYVVSAAGNNGLIENNGIPLTGYFSITCSLAKNALSLGNYNTATSLRWRSSSMGPTFDGRIKPDVMAPGRSIKSTVFNNAYGFNTGTSMASPCAAGVIALMLEAFWDTYGADNPRPLFSTMKAILIQTAQDLIQNPNQPGEPDCPDFIGSNAQPPFFHAGPDWATGYGLINAETAVAMINNKSLYLQDEIDDIGDTDEFPIYVPPGTPEIKVTLVWDDAPGPTTTPDTSLKLINDLNLRLIDPDDTEYYPWVLNPLDPADDGDIDPADMVAATQGEDHINNVEQVQVINPTSGIWKVRVDETGIPEPTQSYSLASNLAFTRRNVAAVQVIDRTGSMSTYGYIEPAKEKAKLFIDLMQPDEQVGVVSFATSCGSVTTTSSVDYPLTIISASETEKTEAKSSVDALVAQGCTPIGEGMQLGQQELDNATPGFKPAMILLSDGFENSTPDVPTVLPTIPDDTDIYTIALGTTVDATLLQNIATTTEGEYYNSPTIEDLQEIYLQLHGALLSCDVLAFEEGELSAGEVEEKEFEVDSLTKEATFVATWLRTADNLTVELYDPNNNPVNASSSVTIYSDNTYRAYRVKIPKPGKWRLKLTGTSVTSPQVNYVASGVVESKLHLSILPHLIKFLTGDRVLLAVRLEASGKPILNSQVKVIVDRPLYWAGNILANPRRYGYFSQDKITKAAGSTEFTSTDSSTPAAAKFYKIVRQSKKNLLDRERFEIALYDDGRHGDEKEGDGIYANYLTKTTIGGDYNFTVSASCSDGSTNTTREMLFSSFNAIKIDAEYSVVDVDLIRLLWGDKGLYYNYNVKIAPKDKFGNYLGPGRPIILKIIYPSGHKQQLTTKDNIDGTYTNEIVLAESDVKAGAKLVIDVDGKTFTTVEKLPTLGKWSISLLGGYTFPVGNFNTNYKSSYMFGLNLNYHFTPQWSLVGFLGYNHFKAAHPVIPNTHWWNVSANLKYAFTTNLFYPFRPYVNGGAGIYIPENGNVKPGVNLGWGLNFSFNANWSAELAADYHHVFASGSPTGFFVTIAGLIYRF